MIAYGLGVLLLAPHHATAPKKRPLHPPQDVHVETYGSLGKEEKVDFILEQIRLTMAKKDFIRTFIIARKVGLDLASVYLCWRGRVWPCACVSVECASLTNVRPTHRPPTYPHARSPPHLNSQVTKKLLEGEGAEMQALKVRFYKLMIEYHSLSGEKARPRVEESSCSACLVVVVGVRAIIMLFCVDVRWGACVDRPRPFLCTMH